MTVFSDIFFFNIRSFSSSRNIFKICDDNSKLEPQRAVLRITHINSSKTFRIVFHKEVVLKNVHFYYVPLE